MLEVTTQEFLTDTEKRLTSVVVDDDFLKIKTTVGNAVLISEAEYNILLEAFKLLLSVK